MSKQNNNTKNENERNQNRASAVTQVPAHTEIQNTRSRLCAIDLIIEKFTTGFFPALVLQYSTVRSAFEVFSSSPRHCDLSKFGNLKSTWKFNDTERESDLSNDPCTRHLSDIGL